METWSQVKAALDAIGKDKKWLAGKLGIEKIQSVDHWANRGVPYKYRENLNELLTLNKSNHAPVLIQQAQTAINNAVSLTMALATLQDALRKADPLDRASCKPYIAAMFDDPDRVDLVHRIVTALDPPSHKAEPEIGALRRTA